MKVRDYPNKENCIIKWINVHSWDQVNEKYKLLLDAEVVGEYFENGCKVLEVEPSFTLMVDPSTLH